MLDHRPKRLVVGPPLASGRLEETLLPKRLALPVFCSDPLSSVAYATEQIVLVLGLGGLALLGLTTWLGLAVVVLLVVVVASYRQTCTAYPNGGGAYVVAKTNLGIGAGLAAASALLVDYVLTVAVSIAAGVAAVTSAAPGLTGATVPLALGCLVVLTLVNLRGVRESGRAFAVPTYAFVVCVVALLAAGAAELATGHAVRAESADLGLQASARTGGALTVFLALRAFASGCTALTGVEAVSNGVPAFREPKSRNAAQTLTIMGVLAIVMFGGITALAVLAHVHMAENPASLTGAPAGYVQRTALGQLGLAVFGASPAFYALQAATAAVLVLAANTAFNGFPVLTSILATDGFAPRQLAHRGDRLVFSNGIVLLAVLAALLLVAFRASVSGLIHLYILGVFLSFTLSQAGMVRHWERRARGVGFRARRAIRRRQAVNALGAAATGLVLVIVLVTKFAQGAWVVTIAIPAGYALMRTIHAHYDAVDRAVAPAAAGEPVPARVHAVVPVARLTAPTLRALAYAHAIRPERVTAVTVTGAGDDPYRSLGRRWAAREIDIPLVELASPYREVTRPLVDYVRALRAEHPEELVSVIIPEVVVHGAWRQLLHNQSALRLKARLLREPGVVVTSVPWTLDDGDAAPAASRPPREGVAA
jgi:amino acid transporter